MIEVVKVVFFGEEKSGKTVLGACFKDPESPFTEMYEQTIGIDMFHKNYSNKDSDFEEDYRLKCWDTSGAPRFKTICSTYHEDAQIGVYCVDLSQPLDKNKISEDIASFKSVAAQNASVIIVGTKSDAAADLKAFEALQYQDDGSFYFIVSVKKKEGTAKLFAKLQELGKYHAFGISKSNVEERLTSKMDDVLLSIPEESSLYVAINNLKQKMTSLSAKKYKLVSNEVKQLVEKLKSSNSDRNEAIKTFETNCYLHLAGDHPVLKAVAKAVAVLAVTAFVTVIAALVGFGIGFAAGAWTGPGAFISGIMMGGAASGIIMGSAAGCGALGLAAGLVTAFGLFKPSPVVKAVHDVAECAQKTSEYDLM